MILYTFDWGENMQTFQKVKNCRVKILQCNFELILEVQGFSWKNICFQGLRPPPCLPAELGCRALTLQAPTSLGGKPFVEGICSILIINFKGGTESEWEANGLIIPLHVTWEFIHYICSLSLCVLSGFCRKEMLNEKWKGWGFIFSVLEFQFKYSRLEKYS